jgi:nucleotide-binding universal stress UspA family protein
MEQYSLKTILLATDGSEGAELAATAAIDLSKRMGAKLHAAHAWVPLAHFAHPGLVPERYHPPYEEGARRILDEQLGRVEQAGAPSRRRTWSREDPPTRYSTSPNGSAPIS